MPDAVKSYFVSENLLLKVKIVTENNPPRSPQSRIEEASDKLPDILKNLDCPVEGTKYEIEEVKNLWKVKRPVYIDR